MSENNTPLNLFSWPMYDRTKAEKDPLWKQVQNIEENFCPQATLKLKEIRATLLVNYGPHSKMPIIKEVTDDPMPMLAEVLTHLTGP